MADRSLLAASSPLRSGAVLTACPIHGSDITPIATLYHWDLPRMLQERYGGWLHRRTADAFASYAEHVARRLGDRIAWWLTINEPWCIATQGYAVGTHPPYLHDETTVLQVAHHLLLAHGLAVPRIRQHSKPEGSPSVSHLSIPPIRAPRPSRR